MVILFCSFLAESLIESFIEWHNKVTLPPDFFKRVLCVRQFGRNMRVGPKCESPVCLANGTHKNLNFDPTDATRKVVNKNFGGNVILFAIQRPLSHFGAPHDA